MAKTTPSRPRAASRKFDLALIPPAPDLQFESPLWAGGCVLVAGIDEAGRGAWAGPVFAAAVILPADAAVAARLPGVRDSKQMSPEQRHNWAAEIRELAAAWAVGFAAHHEIDALGIVPATRLAMARAVAGLGCVPGHLLIDAVRLADLRCPQTSLIKGDARSLSIAAASVLAKTARDAHMAEMDTDYPGYGFARHKGYGTAAHAAAIRALGPCAIHRMTFAPLKSPRLPFDQ